MNYRINIYDQIRGFYTKVFNQEHDYKPTHVSLYMFLLNQNNRSNWTEWFKCPFDTVMMGACINSNKTYYKILNELQEFGLIKYQKGINNFKAPKIHIVKLNTDSKSEEIPKPEQESSSVKFTQLTTLLSTQLSILLSTQQCKQLDTQLSTQLSTHKDILLTSNYKIVISNIKESEISQSYDDFKNRTEHLKDEMLKNEDYHLEVSQSKLIELKKIKPGVEEFFRDKGTELYKMGISDYDEYASEIMKWFKNWMGLQKNKNLYKPKEEAIEDLERGCSDFSKYLKK